jgi:hypothetical protein
MVPTYNGWEDTPEDEREAIELWEEANGLAAHQPRRSRASVPRLSVELDRRG